MSAFDNTTEENANDLEEMIQKCGPHFQATNPMWIFDLILAKTSLNDIKLIVKLMGRPKISIGKGLTLLHQGAQFNRIDWVEYLVDEMHHELEVKTAAGETPLDQAVWKGNFESAFALIQ